MKAITLPLLLAVLYITLPPALAGKRSVSKLYGETCSVCHESGVSGALKRGDSAGWKKLINKKGIAALVAGTMKGVGAMPAKGLCSDCSGTEIEALIRYMAK